MQAMGALSEGKRAVSQSNAKVYVNTDAKVYVMRGDGGLVKLGFSKDPSRRSKEVGAELVHETLVVEQAERIEWAAHKVLSLHGKHIAGDWFDASVEAAISAIGIAMRQVEGEELQLGGWLARAKPENTRYLQMRVSTEFCRRLDDLRKIEQGIPSRSEMLRRLVDRAFDAAIETEMEEGDAQ